MSKKNKSPKVKQLNNGVLVKESNALYVNNPDFYLTFSDLKVSDGIDIIENIMVLSDNYIKSNRKYNTPVLTDEELMEITEEYKDNKNIEGGYISEDFGDLKFIENSYDDITIISVICDDLYLQDFTNGLNVLNSKKGFADARFNLGQIIIIDRALSPKLLIQIYKIATKQKAKFFESLHLPLHINNIVNTDDFLVVAGNLPEDSLDEDYVMEVGLDITNMEYDDEKIDLDEFCIRIGDAVEIACEDAVEEANLKAGILDYFVSEGIQIADLIEACTDIIDENEVTDELEENLESEIIKNIADRNITFLLMSAIEIRDDLNKNRIRELKSAKDIYNDNAFGVAIANSIAGTKAILRYGEFMDKKPGIIYGLGPILDSAFAGLLAGCLTKLSD